MTVIKSDGSKNKQMKKNISKEKKKASAVKLTKDQTLAVELILDFIDKGSPNEWFVLSGKAGTGKTTTISEAINSLTSDKNIICGAISHKAKRVLESKVHNDEISIGFYTIAAMLNMQLNMDTGKFEPTYSNGITPPISKADVIFIDECSMIDEDAMSLIMMTKNSKSKVIYLGDVNQLPPIRENSNGEMSVAVIDAVSPTFNSKNIFYLNERLRQGEESPILPFSDVYSDALSGEYMPEFIRENILSEKGNIYFTTQIDAINSGMNLFKRSVDECDTELIKAICYTNATRQSINAYIRKTLFENADNEFVPGDLLIMMDNFSLDFEGNVLENSTEFQVRNIEEHTYCIDGANIDYYTITTTYKLFGRYVSIPVCKKSSKPTLNALIFEKFNVAKSMSKGALRTEKFQEAHRLKNRFANVDYSYAITSHKSQGSTYRVVILCEKDIMGCYMTSWRTKLRSMYTSITRASKMCVITN